MPDKSCIACDEYMRKDSTNLQGCEEKFTQL